jgi:methylmalonyl-CoA/ethylmalonyl-CoA epimerase
VNSYLKFHHFGLAVRRQEQAAAFAKAMGYQIGGTVFDPEQNVHLAMCTHSSEPALELIWPGEGKGPVDGLVQRHTSGIIYHACYETADLPAALKKLEADGVKVVCVSPPKPALLFNGRKVSFYNVLGMGLIEILQTPAP